MLNYDVLSKKPAVFRYFSGLEVHEFDALNLKINEKYGGFEQKRLSRGEVLGGANEARRQKSSHPSRKTIIRSYLRSE